MPRHYPAGSSPDRTFLPDPYGPEGTSHLPGPATALWAAAWAKYPAQYALAEGTSAVPAPPSTPLSLQPAEPAVSVLAWYAVMCSTQCLSATKGVPAKQVLCTGKHHCLTGRDSVAWPCRCVHAAVTLRHQGNDLRICSLLSMRHVLPWV